MSARHIRLSRWSYRQRVRFHDWVWSGGAFRLWLGKHLRNYLVDPYLPSRRELRYWSKLTPVRLTSGCPSHGRMTIDKQGVARYGTRIIGHPVMVQGFIDAMVPRTLTSRGEA